MFIYVFSDEQNLMCHRMRYSRACIMAGASECTHLRLYTVF